MRKLILFLNSMSSERTSCRTSCMLNTVHLEVDFSGKHDSLIMRRDGKISHACAAGHVHVFMSHMFTFQCFGGIGIFTAEMYERYNFRSLGLRAIARALPEPGFTFVSVLAGCARRGVRDTWQLQVKTDIRERDLQHECCEALPCWPGDACYQNRCWSECCRGGIVCGLARHCNRTS